MDGGGWRRWEEGVASLCLVTLPHSSLPVVIIAGLRGVAQRGAARHGAYLALSAGLAE